MVSICNELSLKIGLVPETKRPSQVLQFESTVIDTNNDKCNVVLNKTVAHHDNSSCSVIMCIQAWSAISNNEVMLKIQI